MDFERTALEFDEVHRLVGASIEKAMEEAGAEMPVDKKELKQTPEEDILDDLLSILILAYERGNRDANEMLSLDQALDINRMDEAINYMIGGKTFKDRAREHIRNADPGRLIDLAESEYHRVYSQGEYDTAKASGRDITKTWLTMLDDRVRETHDFLEGVTVGLDEKFNTIDGDSALIPGGFELAENNCSCRCILRYSFK